VALLFVRKKLTRVRLLARELPWLTTVNATLNVVPMARRSGGSEMELSVT